MHFENHELQAGSEHEQRKEREFTQEEILAVLTSELEKRGLAFLYIENIKEDEHGIYFLEMRARSADGAENMGITFTRTGRRGTREGADKTTIDLVDNDPPIHSEHIATYNEETKEWEGV